MNLIMADKRLRTLTDEGLQTLLKEIEHILNCRPLTELTDEVENTTALTPMMLLSGCVDPGYPPDVFLDSDGMRSSWRACQLQADVFWDRWRSEYLHLLQRRQKWLTPQRNLCVGDLVLLVDENAHRNIWPKESSKKSFPTETVWFVVLGSAPANKKYLRETCENCAFLSARLIQPCNQQTM